MPAARRRRRFAEANVAIAVDQLVYIPQNPAFDRPPTQPGGEQQRGAPQHKHGAAGRGKRARPSPAMRDLLKIVLDDFGARAGSRALGRCSSLLSAFFGVSDIASLFQEDPWAISIGRMNRGQPAAAVCRRLPPPLSPARSHTRLCAACRLWRHAERGGCAGCAGPLLRGGAWALGRPRAIRQCKHLR